MIVPWLLRARAGGAWLLSGTLLLGCLLSGCAPEGPAPPDPGAAPRFPSEASPRNLILISIDTLRADHLGCYGYGRATSPHLDRRAARGTVFLQAISPSSWTVPAHMTLLTGLSPSAHGLYRYPAAGKLPEDAETLAALLLRAGFATAAFTGGGFVSRRHGFQNGFERFQSRGRHFEDNLPDARAWLSARPPGERFFLFLHGFNVHKPYRPPAPFDRRFCPDYAGQFDPEDLEPDRPRPSEEDLEYAIAQYDGEIAHVDQLLEELLAELDAAGTLGETLVVVTSDHGDEMYEHGLVDHIHTLYEELVRVPLILFGPGVAARVVREPVSLLDVFPTVVDLLGVEATAAVQGTSHAARILGGSDPVESGPIFGRTAFSEFPYSLQSVRTERFKLVLWTLSGMKAVDLEALEERPRYTYKFRSEQHDFVELFDLQADPGEQENVAEKHPDVVEAMARLLVEQEEREKQSGLRLKVEAMPAADAEYLEALRALGYVR